MNQESLKKKSSNKPSDAAEARGEGNFEWLAQFREALSPYWASRLEYQPEKKTHVLVLEGTGPKGRGVL